MPSPYRVIFAAPGTKSFTVAGLLGRTPIAMMGIGIVTMVSQITGEYGLAGALAATVALSLALLGPQVSRLVDRYGQRRVLRPATLVVVAAVAGLTLGTQLSWPTWTLFAFTAFAGCVPSIGSMIRARWSAIFHDSPRKLHAAFSWESIIDELCFIIGPIVAIGLSTAWFPQAGPLAAACALTVGVYWLTSQRATEPVPQPRPEHQRGSALRVPGVPIVVLTMVMLGVIFSAIDVITLAFAEERGAKAAASLLLAVYALGSGVAGGLFGLLYLRGSLTRRWLFLVCVVGLSMLPLQLVSSMPALVLALFVAGMTIAPTMITSVGMVTVLVPRHQLTEGMTWVSTGAAMGVSLGASVSGQVVDRVGAEQAYLVPAVAGALAIVVAALGSRRLARRTGGQWEGTVHERQHPVERQRRSEEHLA